MPLSGRRVLFVSYNGMLDPLGQSQVIPYLRELSREGVKFTLLSFERPHAWLPAGVEKCRSIEKQLAGDNIEWHRLRYHKRLSLLATAYDVARGILTGQSLVRRGKIEMVHARNPIMASIALSLKRIFEIKLIFDVRGLLADEYVDAGHWRKGSVKYRLTKHMELSCLSSSDGIVTLTEAIWPAIRSLPSLRERVAHEVIPCCVDLERFRFDANQRTVCRARLGLDGKFVMVYSGSIGGWYMTGEMADFFKSLILRRPNSHFLWLTQSPEQNIRDVMESRNIPGSAFSIVSADPSEVYSYLSAADAGIAFIKPCFSKLASSPTKTAEYLACGLPLILNAGIGDSDLLIEEEHAGVLVKEFKEEEYDRACGKILELSSSELFTRQRAREIAEKRFDVQGVGIDRYARLYSRVLNGT
jgi:glycosyltransferase involved in cell wall biosynthesis